MEANGHLRVSLAVWISCLKLVVRKANTWVQFYHEPISISAFGISVSSVITAEPMALLSEGLCKVNEVDLGD